MKTVKFTQIIIIAMFVTTLASCKKEDVDFSSEYKEQTDDQLQISAEIDMVTMDANNVVESTAYFFGRRTNIPGICDASYTYDSTAAFKFVTINYDGVTCSGRSKRSGQVIISMEKKDKWNEKGAVLNISYKELKITRISDNKSIILNGDLNLTNEAGGRMSDIMNKNIVHVIHSTGMNIQFDDGKKRSWKLSVKRVFSFDNGLVITSTGNHAEGNKVGISAWGITRTGRHFTTKIAEPMIIRQDCSFRMVSAKLIQEQSEILTIEFGLDERGEKISCPAGSYFLQVSWDTPLKKNHSIRIPY